jgi:uncharacterized protein YggE
MVLAIGVAAFECPAGHAQAPYTPPARTGQLVVDASSVVEIVPDLATLRVGATAEANDRDAALLANAKLVIGIIAKARQSGVAAKDIDAGHTTTSPRHETVIVDGREARGRQVGYVASSMLTVTIRDIPRAGVLIRDLLKSGANVVEDIQFSLTEKRMSEAQAEARASALRSAQGYAEAAAHAAGFQLGSLIGVGSPPPADEAADGAADLGLPEEPADVGPVLVLEPGVIEVHDAIRTTWALERR